MNDKTGPHFVWDLTCPQGRFSNDQNFKNLPKQNSIFIKFLKILKIYDFFLIRELFCFVLQCTQREYVYNWNRRWARSALILLLFIYIFVSLPWCLFVCLYPINVKKADPMGPIFWLTSRGPRKDLWMNEFSKICL